MYQLCSSELQKNLIPMRKYIDSKKDEVINDVEMTVNKIFE